MTTIPEEPFCFACEEPPAIDKRSNWVALFNLCERNFQCSTDEIWLDYFPSDVTVRIAQHLVNMCNDIPETRYVSPLQLADTSLRQCLAVKHALKFHVELEGSDDFAIRLAGLMRDDVRSVDCAKWNGEPDVVLPLLGSACLTSACVPYRIHFLQELVMGKVHTLRLCGAGKFWEALGIVEMTSVRQLSIQWDDGGKTKALFESLVASFPNVEKLELEWNCAVAQRIGEDCAELLSGFRRLKFLRTNVPLTGRDVPFLRRLDQVEIFTYGQDPSIINPLEGLYCVTDVLKANVLTAVDVSRLDPTGRFELSLNRLRIFKDCTRLVRLRVPVLHNDCTDLPHLPALESLRLTWTAREGTQEVQPELLSKIVHKLPAIKQVELESARISVENVTWLLEKLGTKLKAFGVSISSPSEKQVRLVTKVMQAVVDFNPRLERLRFFPLYSFRSGDRDRPSVFFPPTRQLTDVNYAVSSSYESLPPERRADISWMICVLERSTAVKNGQELRSTFDKWR